MGVRAIDVEKQRKEIIEKLDELYGFDFIEDFVSLEEILDRNLSYDENILILKQYLLEELLISGHAQEIARRIGNEAFLKLQEDLSISTFEQLMTS